MTTITQELRDKIERRARRAWRAHRDGATRKVSRISDVTDDELYYRLPNTPDYYGKEKVRVIRSQDGTVEVDPKTKGLIDCRVQNDLDRLKKHGDHVRGYVTVRQNGDVFSGDQKLKPGKSYKAKTVRIKSREQCLAEANPGDRVLVVELQADDIQHHAYGAFEAKVFSVTDELDQEKDLGFTLGLLDCLAKSDLVKVKKHIGSVRAYLLKKRLPKSLPLNKKHTLKVGERFQDRETAARFARPGDKVYVAEFDYTEIEKQHTDGLTASVKLVGELDPVADLGFDRGTMLDLVTNADLKALKSHKGMVRAYKYVTTELKSPTQTKTALQYVVGQEFEEPNANTDPYQACGAGINVASQEWCKNEARPGGHRALAFEFHVDDIAAIPSDGGKIRVFRCLCVEEVDPQTYQTIAPPPPPPPPPPPADQPEQKASHAPKKGFFERFFGTKKADEPGDAPGV
ncbi:MAG: hypothetical protein AB7L09_00615 [Nitrospira sp.]